MRLSSKPIRKCYSCLLNLGDRCWLFIYPRGQWESGKKCSAFENEEFYNQYRRWLKQPTVKTRAQLRREAFRSRKIRRLHYRMVRRKRAGRRF